MDSLTSYISTSWNDLCDIHLLCSRESRDFEFRFDGIEYRVSFEDFNVIRVSHTIDGFPFKPPRTIQCDHNVENLQAWYIELTKRSLLQIASYLDNHISCVDVKNMILEYYDNHENFLLWIRYCRHVLCKFNFRIRLSAPPEYDFFSCVDHPCSFCNKSGEYQMVVFDSDSMQSLLENTMR